MLTILAKMVIDVFQAGCAVTGVPGIFLADDEIRCGGAVTVLVKWPFSVGNTEPQEASRLQHSKTLAEKMPDRFRIVYMFKEVFRENYLAAV